MATTDYLQKFREAQRYREAQRFLDIIAASALFEDIVQLLSLGQDNYITPLDFDWLGYRLRVNIFDLKQRKRRYNWYQRRRCSLVQCIGGCSGVIDIQSVHALTPGHSPVLIDLVGYLRGLADPETVSSASYEDFCVKVLLHNPQVLVRDLEGSRARYLLRFKVVTRIPRPGVTDLDKLDCLPPPAPAMPSEEYSVNAIGKVSAISSSKQQPVPAGLDELLHRRGTEDA